MDNTQQTKGWTYRLRYTQQMLWVAITQIGKASECGELRKDVSRSWFSALNPKLKRLLPDGQLAPGAPNPSDIDVRSGYVTEIADGLKQRPRNGDPEPRAKYRLKMYEYDLVLAMTDLYTQAENFIRQPEINAYEAAAWETAANTVMHVAGCDEPEQILYKPFEDEELDTCPL